jgi:asparagine synthase (glutamine-hydrolysing)
MCGIVGFVETKAARSADELAALAEGMALALQHRGPDDAGRWVDAASGVAFGHRRLSVIDLSPTGHQPMVSESGRTVVVLNGEVYNHRELRKDLLAEGARFRGTSDTEVLLEAIEAWGLHVALHRAVGMWALAAWDAKDRTLRLARDRMGEKPLYHGWQGSTFVFASELKALRAHPGFVGGVDRNVAALFLRLAYVPAPSCIHPGLRQLPPGTLLELPLERLKRGEAALELRPTPYWSVRKAATAGLARPFRGSQVEAVDELDRVLRQAVAGQLVADVPVGAFLSGGIDSSTVVALMAQQSTAPVRTFTIGFRERDHDESPFARAVAQHLGTQHEELVLGPEETLAVIPRLPELYDEPFADPSQVPTILVSQLTRRHVTVALSGDGGDELFAGYNRHVWARRLTRALRFFPLDVRRALAAAVRGVPDTAWTALLRRCRRLLPPVATRGNAGERLHRVAALAAEPSARELYLRLVSHWAEPCDLVPDAVEPEWAMTGPHEGLPWRDPVERLQYLDMITYLPDDILTKVDRAAMAVGLETRVPLLDHRVVELAWSLPPQWKLRRGRGKLIQREVLRRYVPGSLFERPKAGFGVPIETWLRGPLRDWAEALLDERRLAAGGLVEARPVREAWAEHVSGERPHAQRLWNVLMLLAWAERWERAPATRPRLPARSRRPVLHSRA